MTTARKHNEAVQVLAVDDDPKVLRMIGFALGTAGYSVLRAGSGEEGIRVAASRRPEIILLDAQMPGMTGADAAAALARRDTTREIPIILMSESADDAVRLKELVARSVEFIAKPLAMSEVVAKVVSITRRNAYRNEAQSNRQKLLAEVSEKSSQLQSALQAFSRFVPGEFLKSLSRTNILQVSLGDQVQTEMAILFADIRSFAAMSEKMSPHETFAFLNAYFARMNPLVWENNGYIDKYVGDAIMAHFPAGPEGAVDAAVAMLGHLVLYNADRSRAGYDPVRVGIGVHTGPVILGIIGDERFMQGTVISDAVNLASRLEQLTKAYGVSLIVSAAVLCRLADPNRFRYRFLDRVCPKGKTEAVPIYEIFEADPPALAESKMRIREEFERGAFEYHAGRAREAAAIFEGIIARGERDRPTEIYHERCLRSAERGLPPLLAESEGEAFDIEAGVRGSCDQDEPGIAPAALVRDRSTK